MKTIQILRSVLLISGCLFCSSAASTATEEKAERRQRYEELQKEWDQKYAEYIKAAEAKMPPSDVAKLRPSIEDFGQRFMKIAKENPADSVGCDALVWLATHGSRGKDLENTIGLLERHHLSSPKLKDVILHLGYSERATALIGKLTEKGGSREVRGFACFYSAIQRYGINISSGKSSKKEMAEIERLLGRVEKDYGDVRADPNTTLGQQAKGWLFEVKHLQPGMKAPEIEGSDVDGKKMKLSDYKGKVVLLVFWSSSCGPCLAEIPNYRKLMADFARRPFTIVGVCCGDEKAQAAKTMTKKKMTWPSFLDGDLGEGKICRQWNIEGIPTVYLIDAAGAILRNRHFDLNESEHQRLLWGAVSSAEKK